MIVFYVLHQAQSKVFTFTLIDSEVFIYVFMNKFFMQQHHFFLHQLIHSCKLQEFNNQIALIDDITYVIKIIIILNEYIEKLFFYVIEDWQWDSSVHDVNYESFDSILYLNRSQKSQKISIQRSLNNVRTLRDQKSHYAEFSLMWQFSSNSHNWFMKKINDMSMSVKDEKILLVIKQLRWRVWKLWLQVIKEFATRWLRWYWNVFITSTVSSSNWWKDIR